MNAILQKLEENRPSIDKWFEDMHRQPELSMQEVKTARLIAQLLESWGYEVATGVGTHGIVATLREGEGERSIGLRADFDALPIEEVNDLPYRSENEGVAHLCGHDGHTTMLLAAAQYLAETRNFKGTVRLIFQPGEETMQGALAMIKDGLFERFPMDAVFGMHNMPGLELGKLYFTEGEVMAAVDSWEIEIQGKGSHGATPELGVDPIVAGSSLVMALQTVVSRNLAPANSAVVTVGAFVAGSAGNVVPQSAILRLSIRTKTPADRALVLDRIRTLTQHQCESFGCSYQIREGVPGSVLINSKEETKTAFELAKAAFGEENVHFPGPTFLGSEDFAFMLEHRPGTYCFIGNGDTPMLHHPAYTFNKRLLTSGAAYWVALVEGLLSTSGD